MRVIFASILAGVALTGCVLYAVLLDPTYQNFQKLDALCDSHGRDSYESHNERWRKALADDPFRAFIEAWKSSQPELAKYDLEKLNWYAFDVHFELSGLPREHDRGMPLHLLWLIFGIYPVCVLGGFRLRSRSRSARPSVPTDPAPDVQPATGSAKARWGATGVALLVLICGVSWGVPRVRLSQQKSLLKACNHQLESIRETLEQQRLINLERSPAGEALIALLREKLPNPKTLRCPADTTGDPTYQTLLVPLTEAHRATGERVPWIWDRGLHHPGGRNVLFVNGDVRQVPEARFQKLLEAARKQRERVAALDTLLKATLARRRALLETLRTVVRPQDVMTQIEAVHRAVERLMQMRRRLLTLQGKIHRSTVQRLSAQYKPQFGNVREATSKELLRVVMLKGGERLAPILEPLAEPVGERAAKEEK